MDRTCRVQPHRQNATVQQQRNGSVCSHRSRADRNNNGHSSCSGVRHSSIKASNSCSEGEVSSGRFVASDTCKVVQQPKYKARKCPQRQRAIQRLNRCQQRVQAELSTHEGTRPELRTRLAPVKACLIEPDHRLCLQSCAAAKYTALTCRRACKGGERYQRLNRCHQRVQAELSTHEGTQPKRRTRLAPVKACLIEPDRRLCLQRGAAAKM